MNPVQRNECERHFGSVPQKRQKTDPVMKLAPPKTTNQLVAHRINPPIMVATNAQDNELSPVHPFHSQGNIQDNTGNNNGGVKVGTWNGKQAVVKYARRVNYHGVDIKKEIKSLKEIAKVCGSSRRDGCQHVVTFYDIAYKYDPSGTKLYGIVMEYLNGGTLEKHRLTPRRWDYIAPVHTGLNVLHRNNIIHCDVMPDNIVLHCGDDGTTRAVLTDLGLAVRRGQRIILEYRGFHYLGVGAPATRQQRRR